MISPSITCTIATQADEVLAHHADAGLLCGTIVSSSGWDWALCSVELVCTTQEAPGVYHSIQFLGDDFVVALPEPNGLFAGLVLIALLRRHRRREV